MPHHIGDGIEFRQARQSPSYRPMQSHDPHPSLPPPPSGWSERPQSHERRAVWQRGQQFDRPPPIGASNEYDFTGPWPNADFNHLEPVSKREAMPPRRSRQDSQECAPDPQACTPHTRHRSDSPGRILVRPPSTLHPFSEGNHLARKVAAKELSEIPSGIISLRSPRRSFQSMD